MLKRILLTVGCTSLLAVAGFAADQPKPSCCASKCAKPTAATQPAQKMRCSLTGKVVDHCCCVEKDGKTHCTLADKDVTSCCCQPVSDETKKS